MLGPREKEGRDLVPSLVGLVANRAGVARILSTY
jgi:hypothetical protein